jgi:pimeloyl-ACP methyl ester carboxylesterase
MIKLTRVASEIANAPKIFILSGGPGISSLTLRDLDLLKRSFELIYLDMQGTNDSLYEGKKTFSELCTLASDIISNETGEKYILGHSYGGFLAAGIFQKDTFANGLICIATPFSKESLATANDTYSSSKTLELSDAENAWAEKQDDSSFAKWLSEYGALYFKNHKAKELLLNDKVSAQFFKDNRSDISNDSSVLEHISKIKLPKIFITGKEDKLLPSEVLKNDALAGGFDFFEVEDASHFVTVDNPEKVAGLIERHLLRR